MPVISFRESLVGGATATPLSGSQFEFLPYDAQVEFALNQQSAAINDILATVNSGSDILQEEGPISAQARSPIYPDDFFLDDVAAAGERLKIRLRNTTAATTIVVVGAVRITPLVG